jgi:type II secretory pathway component GspD/PulD (secretin)
VITVENHKTAEILLEDKLPVPKQTLTPSGIVTAITYETIKTSLKITPSVINSKLVKLHIQTSFGLLVGRQVIAGLEAPIISNRRANTLVTLPSEGEIFIGGITRKDRVQVRRGIPFLMDIPIIGALFSKYEEEEGKAEIFFYIKVEIFPPQKPPTRTSESETKK